MKFFTFENENFRFTVGENAVAESLIYKKSGEELLMAGENISLFSLTQLRPFNNEVKLAYMNKRTTFEANHISVDGNKITVEFEIIPCKALVTVDVKDEYMTFTLTDFIYDEKAYEGLTMDTPPVEEFRLLQLPIKPKKNFGQWINAMWDDTVSCAVIAANPEAIIDSQLRNGYRILTADAQKKVQLIGTTAALVVSGGKEDFLNVIDRFERDFNLPLGVESRRNPIINRSIYWTSNLTPDNVDEHIKYAKMGGFSCMLILITYDATIEYPVSKYFPNGYDDVRPVIKKIKDAGITPGLHYLHTHISSFMKYITPVADPRLNITDYFTLTRPLGVDDDKVFVAENPKNALKHEKRRVLKFGGELMTYEGFSTEPPYHFYGVKRGFWDTNVTPHECGIIGGNLDISEFGAWSVYINQYTDLQDEVAEHIANIYDCGFEFFYFDGSEGTNAPYEYHVPNAQYRVIKKLGSAPKFCEGAAKAHFGWHILSGANAFDVFKTDEFKAMLDKHPLAEAPNMAEDFTRLNFGWWDFYEDTRRDVYEYGTSHAHGWDCPATVFGRPTKMKAHARIADILGVMKRWEDVRRDNLLSKEQKELIRVPGKEYTLFVNEEGKYELTPYFELTGVGGEGSGIYVFTLERDKKSYALIWHNTASAKLSIPVSPADAVSYETDFTKEKLSIEENGDSIVIDVSDSAYLATKLSVEELRSALAKAKVV